MDSSVTVTGAEQRSALIPSLLLAVLAVCFGWCVFKAATASFTIDESYTFLKWVAVPWSNLPSLFDSNNHPFNTLLCRLSFALFGPAEVSLRLPNLLASLLYFYAVYRAAHRLLGSTIWTLLTVTLACANPLVLDHFSTARGYGLGIAFWTLGFWLIVDRLNRQAPLGFLSGLALALSAMAYLTQAYPVAALVIIAIALSPQRRKALPFAAPIVAAGAFLAWFASHIPIEPFLGERVFRRGIIDLLNAALNYRAMPWAKDLLYDILYRSTWPLLVIFLILLFLSLLLVLRSRRPDPPGRNLLLIGGTLLLTAAFLFFEPRLRHHIFFSGRRLLCAWPPLVFGLTVWLSWIAQKGRIARIGAWAGAAALGLLSIHTIAQFQPRTFYQWSFDAGAKPMARMLQERRPAKGTATIATSALLDQTMGYYSRRYSLDWISRIENDRSCLHDYWVVGGQDWPSLARFDPVVLYRDPDVGSRLAQTGPRYLAGVAAIREIGYSGPIGCTANPALTRASTATLQPGVNEHFLHDVGAGGEDAPQLWAFERPAYIFRAPSKNVRLSLHVRLAAVTFQVTGPVTMTVYVNGHRLGDEHYTTPEDHVYEHDVPADWLRSDGLTVVETTLDRYWIAPDDGAKLGYLFIGGGLARRP